MIENIMDASAILAYLQNEKGKDRVEKLLETSAISRINATEVLTKLIEKGMSLNKAKEAFDNLDLQVIEFDES